MLRNQENAKTSHRPGEEDRYTKCIKNLYTITKWDLSVGCKVGLHMHINQYDIAHWQTEKKKQKTKTRDHLNRSRKSS